jgi:hypothetical protein
MTANPTGGCSVNGSNDGDRATEHTSKLILIADMRLEWGRGPVALNGKVFQLADSVLYDDDDDDDNDDGG